MFKHTFNVSLLWGFKRKFAKKKSISKSISWGKNGVPLEKGLSALNKSILRSAITLCTSENTTLFESKRLIYVAALHSLTQVTIAASVTAFEEPCGFRAFLTESIIKRLILEKKFLLNFYVKLYQ